MWYLTDNALAFLKKNHSYIKNMNLYLVELKHCFIFFFKFFVMNDVNVDFQSNI